MKNWLKKVVEFAENNPFVEIISVQSKARTFRVRFVENVCGFRDEELALLKAGELIQTIKSVRQRTNMGLMEAKAFVEAFIAKHPEAYVRKNA